MVGSVNIKVYDNKVKYDLNVERRISVIVGDSGTGKSLLCDMVKNFKKNPNISIVCNYPVEVLDYVPVNIKETLKSFENKIILIDEDCDILHNFEFQSSCLNYDIYFIIISRDLFCLNIPHSVYSIYKFKYSGKFIVNTKYCDFKLNNKKFLSVTTEDEKSGKLYFSKFCKDVKSLDGKDNILNYISKKENLYRLYIIDLAAFGDKFHYVAPLIKSNLIDLADIESFEYMLLNSSLFLNSKYKDFILNPQNHYNYEFKTYEKYFTWLLNNIMVIETGNGYSKSKICECTTKRCCFKGKHCDLFSNVEDKVQDTLKHNDLLYLLNNENNNNISPLDLIRNTFNSL